MCHQRPSFRKHWQGIDRVARRSLLLHRLATLEQPDWVPRLVSKVTKVVVRFTKVVVRLTKVVVRFTKEGWRVDQLEPRLVGMLNVARMQVWSKFGSDQFRRVQVLKQRGEEEETCNAEVAPFNCQQLLQDRFKLKPIHMF